MVHLGVAISTERNDQQMVSICLIFIYWRFLGAFRDLTQPSVLPLKAVFLCICRAHSFQLNAAFTKNFYGILWTIL